MKRWTAVSLSTLFLVAAAGCSDIGGSSPVAPDLAPGLELNEQVPTYAEERPGTFADMPDESLWEHVAYSGRVAVVGLRKPGANRGVYKGRILVDRASWMNARQAVVTQRGVELIFADTLLPTVRVKLDDIDALRAVRKLPFVSYVEPIRAVGERGFEPTSCGSSGGSSGSSSGGPDLWAGTGTLYSLPSGDLYSDRHVATGVHRAWLRGAAGAGTHIGLIDTGMADLPYFYSQWTAGESGGRYLMHGRTQWGLLSGPSGDTPCGHGTLMAGAIAAPRDGQNVVGVAYQANLLEVHHGGGDVWGVGADDAQHAIRLTANTLRYKSGGKLITMPFQSFNWWWQVSDEISYWHNTIPTLLFFGSAGTDAPPGVNVVFPANHGNVLAVTCATYPSGNLDSRCSGGSQVEFMAYQYTPSYQYNNTGISRIGGSSNANAVLVGIAAQVWSRYPSASRAQVVQRLRESGDLWPHYPQGTVGVGIVNAHRATGGLTRLRIDGPVSVAPYSTFQVMAVHDGEGPTFNYNWGNGHTGSTFAPAGTTAGAVPTRAYQVSYTAGAAGTSVLVQVTVTDPSDGTQKTESRWVAAQVQDPYSCVDPMQPCCDPTDPICY